MMPDDTHDRAAGLPSSVDASRRRVAGHRWRDAIVVPAVSTEPALQPSGRVSSGSTAAMRRPSDGGQKKPCTGDLTAPKRSQRERGRGLCCSSATSTTSPAIDLVSRRAPAQQSGGRKREGAGQGTTPLHVRGASRRTLEELCSSDTALVPRLTHALPSSFAQTWGQASHQRTIAGARCGRWE